MTREHLKPALLILSIVIFITTSLLIVLNAEFRGLFNRITQSNERTVVAQLESSLDMPNKQFKIIKVQHNQSLWLEVYDLNLSEDRVADFKIASKYDGQMFVDEKASNLFVTDIDGDQILEIITPSFDSQLKPKIHAFRYNPITDSFSRVSNQELLNTINM